MNTGLLPGHQPEAWMVITLTKSIPIATTIQKAAGRFALGIFPAYQY
jgi:hypothetical protein